MSQIAPERRLDLDPEASSKERFEDLDRAWTFYREERATCAQLLDQKKAVQILPERLSEAF